MQVTSAPISLPGIKPSAGEPHFSKEKSRKEEWRNIGMASGKKLETSDCRVNIIGGYNVCLFMRTAGRRQT